MSERNDNWKGMNWIRQEKRLAIYLRDGLACVYCGGSLEDGVQLSLDHLLPVSQGGHNEAYNLVTCCSPCNSLRGASAWKTFAYKSGDKNGEFGGQKVAAFIRETINRQLDIESAKQLIAARKSARRTDNHKEKTDKRILRETLRAVNLTTGKVIERKERTVINKETMQAGETEANRTTVKTIKFVKQNTEQVAAPVTKVKAPLTKEQRIDRMIGKVEKVKKTLRSTSSSSPQRGTTISAELAEYLEKNGCEVNNAAREVKKPKVVKPAVKISADMAEWFHVA